MTLNFIVYFVVLLYTMRTVLMYLIEFAAVAVENTNPKNTCIVESYLMWAMSLHKISQVVLGILLGSFSSSFVLPYRVELFFFSHLTK